MTLGFSSMSRLYDSCPRSGGVHGDISSLLLWEQYRYIYIYIVYIRVTLSCIISRDIYHLSSTDPRKLNQCSGILFNCWYLKMRAPRDWNDAYKKEPGMLKRGLVTGTCKERKKKERVGFRLLKFSKSENGSSDSYLDRES